MASGAGEDNGQSVAVDASGNVYAAGVFSGTASIAGVNMTSAGGRDAYLVKYNASGTAQWRKQFGGPNDDNISQIQVDASNNVLLTGYFRDTADFGTGTLTSAGLNDMIIGYYNGTTGAAIWVRQIGSVGDDVGFAVALDSATTSAAVTGGFMGTVNFGAPCGNVTAVSTSQYDSYAMKFTVATGACVWAKQWVNGSTDYGTAIAFDPSGNVILSGIFLFKIDFGGGILTTFGNEDVYLAKFTSAGIYTWANHYGGTATDFPKGVVVTSGGDVILTGYFGGTANFGTGNLVASGAWDGVLARYVGSTGVATWAKRFGGIGADYGYAVALDTTGNVLLTGLFNNTIDFGNGTGTLTSAGDADIYVTRFSVGSGAALVATRYGGIGADYGSSIASVPAGTAAVTGTFHNTMTIGGNSLTSAGLGDAFVAVVP